MQFRRDLYKGTAEYYDRFRPAYPKVLLDDLRARVPVARRERLLDLACGTGQIAFSLASDFAEVVAVDQEAAAIEFAQRKAATSGVENIRFVVGSAEQVAIGGVFDLVGIGNAFHRLDRNAVARRVARQLRKGGCVALMWSDTPWRGDERWQRAMAGTLDKWMHTLGAGHRIPSGWQQALDRDPNPDVLRRAGLAYEGRYEFTVPHEWSIESLMGFVYSTSFLNRAVLGRRTAEFENDLRVQLTGADGGDVFRQDCSFAYELARLDL